MNETTQPIQFEKLYLEPENKTLSEVMDNSKSCTPIASKLAKM